jgi:hypothetical protein
MVICPNGTTRCSWQCCLCPDGITWMCESYSGSCPCPI